MGLRKALKKVKRAASKIRKVAGKLAPVVAGFVPVGGVAMKAASALKSAGVNYKRLGLAERGKLVSALPVSENVTVQKARIAPAKRISVTGTRSALAKAPKKKSAFVVEMEQRRKDNAYLNSLLANLGKDEVIQLRAEWTRNPEGYTWPEYIAKKLA